MNVRTLVGHIKSEVEEQKKTAIVPQVSQAGDFYFSNLEAQLTFLELDAVIKQLEAFDQDQKVTLDHVKIITSFLERRWERIKNTDLIYPINNEHYITRLCLYIANYLASQRGLVRNNNHYALLMPTVKNWHNDRSHMDLWTLYLHNILLDDTNQVCFQLGYVDLSMNKTNTDVDMSVPLDGNEDNRHYLTPAEKDRYYKHSGVISTFIDLNKELNQESARLRQENKSEDEIQGVMKKLQQSIMVAKDNIVKALRDQSYGKRTVQSSYGKEGLQVLKNNLLKHANSIFVNRDQIFEYMSAHLAPNQWAEFLAKMTDSDKFIRLMLEGIDIQDVVLSKNLFKQDAVYNRAAAFCMVEAYSRLRMADGEYTSTIGYISSFFARVFPKVIKEKVIQIMQKFLTDGANAGVDVTKFFFAGDMDATRRAQFNDQEIDLLYAMQNSRAGKIRERICELLLPAETKDNDLKLQSVSSPACK